MKAILNQPLQTNYQYFLEKSKEVNYKRNRFPLENTKQIEFSPKDVATRLHGKANLIDHNAIKDCFKFKEIAYPPKLSNHASKNSPGVQTKRNYNCNFRSYDPYGLKTHAFLNAGGRRMGEVMEDSRTDHYDRTASKNKNFELIVNPKCPKKPQATLPPIMSREDGMLYRVKTHLIKAIATNFPNPHQAFSFFDQENKGHIDVETLKNVLKKFNIYLSSHQTLKLIKLCKVPDDHALIDPELQPCPVLGNCIGTNERMAFERNPGDNVNFWEFMHFLFIPAQPQLAKKYKSPVIRPNRDKSTYREEYPDYGMQERTRKMQKPEEKVFQTIYPSPYVRLGLSDDDVKIFKCRHPNLFK